MVNKPLKPCNKFGCNHLTREQYCQEHKHKSIEQKKERNRYYDKYKRDKKSDSFYRSREWDVVRRASLSRDKGLCVHCLREKKITHANVVDHIIPVKEDWSLRLTLSNTQCLCHSHHNQKSTEDERKYKG